MQIVWNGFCFANTSGGIFHASHQVLRNLIQIPSADDYHIVGANPESQSYLAELANHEHLNVSYSNVGQSSGRQLAWLYIHSKPYLRRHFSLEKRILIHAMSNFDLPVRRRQDAYILTVHDIIPLANEAKYGVTRYSMMLRWMLNRAFKRADAIVTLSEASKLTIQKFFPKLRQPIHVFYWGYDHFPEKSFLKADNERLRMIFVGRHEAYKRLDIYLDLLTQVKKLQNKDLIGIVVTNSEGKTFIERSYPQLLSEGRLQVFTNAPPTQIAKLYEKAAIAVIPSEIEGFGLPMVEALRAGCQVVTREGTSMAEYAAGADKIVTTVQAESVLDDWLSGLEAASVKFAKYSDTELNHERLTLFAKRPTWQDAALNTHHLYKDVF